MNITDIATLISLPVAGAAAWFAWLSANSWKESSLYDSRTKAVSEWVGMAAAFRGRLKFVYKETLHWSKDEDKADIEYVSKHFWSWVELWPSVKASLDGDLKEQAEKLWQKVYEAYSALMNSQCTLDQFGLTVEAVYNSDLLEKTLKTTRIK
ncbi:hypothetical protein [Aeromonas veronii]|uniref:hypothetical protein n=1 Tax=Aeromonas veronii TaxID=654 RepID=UPI00111677DD|nr:hypothetical protein [Aeromonas veronii]